jgi:hypothetical protein
MDKSTISQNEAIELQKQYAALRVAQNRVYAALQTEGFLLEGDRLERLVEEERKESAIRKRIKAILGA